MHAAAEKRASMSARSLREIGRGVTPIAILILLLAIPARAGDWWVPDKTTGCNYHSHRFSDHPNVRISWTGACKDDKLEGYGTFIVYFKGNPALVYQGYMIEGSENGRGKRFPAADLKGDTYDGNWRNGLKHGSGTEKYPTGLALDGEWADGVIQKIFAVTSPNGERKEIHWARDIQRSGSQLDGEELAQLLLASGSVGNTQEAARIEGPLVIDQARGLRWTRFAQELYGTSLSYAKSTCGKIVLEGISAWRLPTIEELERAAEYKNLFPVDSRKYSFSSTTADEGRSVYYINLETGAVAKARVQDYLWRGSDFQLCVAAAAAPQRKVTTPFPESPLVDKGEVTEDRRFGLLWANRPGEVRVAGNQAASYCASLNLGGRNDWRVPSPHDFDLLMEQTEEQVRWLTELREQGRIDPRAAEVMSSMEHPGGGIHLSKNDDFWTSARDPNDRGNGTLWGYLGFSSGALTGQFKVLCVSGLASQSTIVGKKGLVWMNRDASVNSWYGAQEYCSTLRLGGYTDWRLPTLRELNAEFGDAKKLATSVFRTPSGIEVGGATAAQIWASNQQNINIAKMSTENYETQSRLTVLCVRGGRRGR